MFVMGRFQLECQYENKTEMNQWDQDSFAITGGFTLLLEPVK